VGAFEQLEWTASSSIPGPAQRVPERRPTTAAALVRLAKREPTPRLWQKWLDWDPVAAPRYPSVADGLRGIWIEPEERRTATSIWGAGRSGTRWAGPGSTTTPSHFELFEGTHANINYRYPMALTWLAERIAA